jgi:uncharacterized protein YjiK
MKKKRLNILLLLIIIFIVISCNVQDSVGPQQSPGLKLIGEHTLSIPEPSGLTLNKDCTALWAVSDNTNNVYNITLEGDILTELNFNGNDLEGIVYDSTDNSLWLAEEQLREVVHIDLNGNELERFSINVPGSGNSGLEGICLDTASTHYLLNEKDPRLWAKLSNDFSTQIQKEINEVDDLSGITFDASMKMFWIVSDVSRLLFLWDPDQGIVKRFDLPFAKAEGVAYDPLLNRIYIVSDLTNKLYVYEFESS